jgi:hypothetical protein
VGGVFGIALLGTILTTRLSSTLRPALAGLELPPSQVGAIEAAAGHGRLDPSLLATLPPERVAQIHAAFNDAFLSGFRGALLVAAVVLFVAAVVANRFIPGRAHRGLHAEATQPQPVEI